MVSTGLLNLIVSIVALGILAAVMRCGYLIAGGRLLHASHTTQQQETRYDLERAAWLALEVSLARPERVPGRAASPRARPV
jgi:hypothetical protein